MSNGVFIMDGIDYNIDVMKLTRNFEVADYDTTGRTADWVMHRDVVGTFYNYTMEIAVRNYDYNSYNRFYEAISAPVKSHRLIIPYGAGTITFQAYVTNGSDDLIIRNSTNVWRGTKINFIAMEPQRRT